MKFIELTIVLLSLSSILTKRKRHKVMSSESIENILYYKDCNHKQKPTSAPLLRSLPPQQCKMICTMCCGDQCINNQQFDLGRQSQVPEAKVSPIITSNVAKDRKLKGNLLSPLPGRRGLGFTRENIKNLIAKDDDIRKILKDLVRVTMQKVDLMQLMNSKQNPVKKNSEVSDESSSSNVL